MAKPTTQPRSTANKVRARRKRVPAESRNTDSLSDDLSADDVAGETESDSRTGAFNRYLRDVDGAAPLLTGEEELELGRRLVDRAVRIVRERLQEAQRLLKRKRLPRKLMRERESAEAFIACFNPTGLKDRALDAHLLRIYFLRGEDCPPQQAMFRMIAEDAEGSGIIRCFAESNLRLVIVMAKRYDKGALPFPELVQEGNMGLLHAIPRYDYRKGFRFSTFATWWIRHAISRAMADKARTIRLPVHLVETSYKIEKARAALTSELTRPPAAEEIAKVLGIPVETLEKMRRWTQSTTSLDKIVGDEQDEPLISFIADEQDDPEVWTTLTPGKDVELLRKALQDLRGIDGDVLRLRYGFSGEELTLREIGDKFGLSRERIRQLERRGLERLRTRLPQILKAA